MHVKCALIDRYGLGIACNACCSLIRTRAHPNAPSTHMAHFSSSPALLGGAALASVVVVDVVSVAGAVAGAVYAVDVADRDFALLASVAGVVVVSALVVAVVVGDVVVDVVANAGAVFVAASADVNFARLIVVVSASLLNAAVAVLERFPLACSSTDLALPVVVAAVAGVLCLCPACDSCVVVVSLACFLVVPLLLVR